LKKTIRVELVGGLGNQLFQFFAAKYVADRENCNLELISNRIGFLETDHGFHLGNLVNKEHYSSKESMFPKLSAYSSRIFEKIQRRLLPEVIVRRVFKTYNSRVIGYDSKIECVKPTVTIRGYFQTYHYFSSDIRYRKMLRLESSSSWCKEMEKVIESGISTSIHVRYGDYASLKDTFGLLDEEYYRRAVALVEEFNSESIYFVFSDDLNWAKSVLHFLPTSRTMFVLPPSESNPAESMYLMSLSDYLVGANSTFSYWSGLLMNDNSIVISPEKWFRNLEDPSDLRPPSWIKCKSSWVS
jgi:hypothetical protein